MLLFKKLLLLTKLFITYSILMNDKRVLNKYCTNCYKCSNGFTGSGILLYEKNICDEKIFVLGIDYKNELTDFGGRIDNVDEKVYDTALREFNEETKRTLNLTRGDIFLWKHVDIYRNNHKYRCYIVKTEYFDIDEFNSKKINNNLDFNEIKNIIKINENKLKKIINETNQNERAMNLSYDISPRLIKILNTYYSS